METEKNSDTFYSKFSNKNLKWPAVVGQVQKFCKANSKDEHNLLARPKDYFRKRYRATHLSKRDTLQK